MCLSFKNIKQECHSEDSIHSPVPTKRPTPTPTPKSADPEDSEEAKRKRPKIEVFSGIEAQLAHLVEFFTTKRNNPERCSNEQLNHLNSKYSQLTEQLNHVNSKYSQLIEQLNHVNSRCSQLDEQLLHAKREQMAFHQEHHRQTQDLIHTMAEARKEHNRQTQSLIKTMVEVIGLWEKEPQTFSSGTLSNYHDSDTTMLDTPRRTTPASECSSTGVSSTDVSSTDV